MAAERKSYEVGKVLGRLMVLVGLALMLMGGTFLVGMLSHIAWVLFLKGWNA